MMRVTFTLREAARLQQASGARTVAELAADRVHATAPGLDDITDPIGCDEETFATVGTWTAYCSPLLARIHD